MYDGPHGDSTWLRVRAHQLLATHQVFHVHDVASVQPHPGTAREAHVHRRWCCWCCCPLYYSQLARCRLQKRVQVGRRRRANR